jgi:hypothetical protein
MEELKSKIANTVQLPQFLKDWNECYEIKEEVYEIVYDILNEYYSGVKERFLGNYKIKKTCLNIDALSIKLTRLTPSVINLKCWLWIGDTIERWMHFSIAEELYETTTNLRKLLNSEYV